MNQRSLRPVIIVDHHIARHPSHELRLLIAGKNSPWVASGTRILTAARNA